MGVLSSFLASVASFADGVLKNALVLVAVRASLERARAELRLGDRRAGEARLSSTVEQLTNLANANRGPGAESAGLQTSWISSRRGIQPQRPGPQRRGRGPEAAARFAEAVRLFAAVPEEQVDPPRPQRLRGGIGSPGPRRGGAQALRAGPRGRGRHPGGLSPSGEAVAGRPGPEHGRAPAQGGLAGRAGRRGRIGAARPGPAAPGPPGCGHHLSAGSVPAPGVGPGCGGPKGPRHRWHAHRRPRDPGDVRRDVAAARTHTRTRPASSIACWPGTRTTPGCWFAGARSGRRWLAGARSWRGHGRRRPGRTLPARPTSPRTMPPSCSSRARPHCSWATRRTPGATATAHWPAIASSRPPTPCGRRRTGPRLDRHRPGRHPDRPGAGAAGSGPVASPCPAGTQAGDVTAAAELLSACVTRQKPRGRIIRTW